MIIKNASVFMPSGRFEICDICFNDRITDRTKILEEEEVDGSNCYLIPGLIDIHTHGAVGEDASDGSPNGLAKMSQYYASHGVTSFCATTMTLPEIKLNAAMDAVRMFESPDDGASLAGVYLEGPFLSYKKRGAQNGDYLHKPDIEMFKRLNDRSGNRIKICGIAPEEPDSIQFIQHVSNYCTVSLAHTTADYQTACTAFENGAAQATHLFNGMSPFAHREPGVVGAAMDKGACVELICDGLHVHPCVIRCTFKMFLDRVILISDSLRCAGMPDGKYDLGEQEVFVKGGRATLENGVIAGSCITLMDGLKNAVAFGVSLEQAVLSATFNPAKAIGMENEIGVIKKGAVADLVLLDDSLNIKEVFVKGRRLSGVGKK